MRKLLEQPMKVLEKVLEKLVRCQLITCSLASCLAREPLMPFSSCDKKNTMQKKKKLYYAFVDLIELVRLYGNLILQVLKNVVNLGILLFLNCCSYHLKPILGYWAH